MEDYFPEFDGSVYPTGDISTFRFAIGSQSFQKSYR
jgi:hypothetical protein